jgi:F0F1-type ATP synthase assembly protein I
MSQSPRLTESDASQTTTRPLSGPVLIIMTALDTTWRLFAPTLGGVFLGIWLDSIYNTAPIWTIICLIVGTVLSIVLVLRQLNNVRKPLK